MQESYKIYKRIERSFINNLRDDKNKLLDEVSESNNIVIRITEDNTNKIGKAPSKEYENTINEPYEHMVFWKNNLFHLPSNSAAKQFADELTKLTDCWMSDSPSSTTALKSLMLL